MIANIGQILLKNCFDLMAWHPPMKTMVLVQYDAMSCVKPVVSYAFIEVTRGDPFPLAADDIDDHQPRIQNPMHRFRGIAIS